MTISNHTAADILSSEGMTHKELYRANLERLLREADEALATDRISVVDNPSLPASGNPHDYYSIAPYSWPNPDTPDGLPYVDRDGQFNPEFELCDRRRMDKICRFTRKLTLAYLVTGEEKYKAHAVKLLRCFFIDEKTKMNPHLEYAQEIRGRYTGRSIGIIDIRYYYRMLDMVKILGCGELDAELKPWMSELLDWLLTSEKGLKESSGTNNHGCWYDVTCSSIALYVGRRDVAVRLIGGFEEKRMAAQVAPDGGMPRELKRTRAYLYSSMNLYSFFTAASIGKELGMDLFRSEPMKRAFDFMLPYFKDFSSWPYKQVAENWEETWEQIYEILTAAASEFGYREGIADARAVLEKNMPDSDIVYFV